MACAAGGNGGVLRGAPVIDVADLVDAADGAVGGAGLSRCRYSRRTIFEGVLGQRLAGVAALLRAVVHQAVLADVHVARAGAATPVVRLAVRDVVLEVIEAREAGASPCAFIS